MGLDVDLNEVITEYCVYSVSAYKFLERVEIDQYLNISEAYFTNNVHDAIKFNSLNEASGIAQMLMRRSNFDYKVVRVFIDFTVV